MEDEIGFTDESPDTYDKFYIDDFADQTLVHYKLEALTTVSAVLFVASTVLSKTDPFFRENFPTPVITTLFIVFTLSAISTLTKHIVKRVNDYQRYYAAEDNMNADAVHQAFVRTNDGQYEIIDPTALEFDEKESEQEQ